MREILCRGKNTENNVWIEGTPVYYDSGEVAIYPINGMLSYGYECTELCRYSVIPKTVGQYTGMQDVKGKKIFEGDTIYLAGFGEYEAIFPFLELYEAYPESDIGMITGNIHEEINNDCNGTDNN